MLEEKIKVISQDKSGRLVRLVNETGLESNGVVTGYGPTNGDVSDVLEYILAISRIYSPETYFIRITPTTISPLLVDVLNGQEFMITSSMFTNQESIGGAYMFEDGVINVNSYSAFQGDSDVVIEKDTNFILNVFGSKNFTADSIQVNGVIYDIDKVKTSQSLNTVFILGDFKEDATEYQILYKGNTKALFQSITDNQHAYITAKLAETTPLNRDLFVGRLNEALHYKIAANGFVKHCKDWSKANDLVTGASIIINNILRQWG